VLHVLTYDDKKDIYSKIPTSFTVRGQTVPVVVRYANQWEADIWPAIILEYTEDTVKSYDFIDLNYDSTNQKIEDITFVSGTLVYSLSGTKVKEIVTVEGLLSGRRHTFVQGTDYQLDAVNDEIEWLGVDVPDDGTDFRILYKFKWVRLMKGGEKFDILSVNVMAKDWGSVDTNNFINGIVLAEEIAGQLHRLFEYSIEPPDNTVFVTESTIRNLDALTEGEYQRRRQFDVRIRHVELVETLVESIEDVDEEVSME